MSHYDPSHVGAWFLKKLRITDREQINAAHKAVIVRETEKACQVQWLSAAGEILHEGWVPKSAMELKADAMKRIAGEDALKTELRTWMWDRGLPSEGTESIVELQNVVLWHGLWLKLPMRFQRAHVKPLDLLVGEDDAA